ncbi:TonB-dependent receptor family protein [Pandoraea pulmonicola]|uniref:Iron transporter n=1 Tax=Pandoraea pulmonicola TaxID=93221 RepID=A0AAJ4ZDC4_PANPU|nr:TonB-dependent siderophore receptor [Pandoraea pulmonicola]AJC20283.1 iron transporter [Pandoraea pulmonicola]SUA91363.1 Iron(III) dicitrate transport protein FecA [Pandoraea pulmonicola]
MKKSDSRRALAAARVTSHVAVHTPPRHRLPRATTCAVALLMATLGTAHAQQATTAAGTRAADEARAEVELGAVNVSGDWLGTGLDTSAKTFPGARTVVKKPQIEESGATSIGDVMRRIPGVQATDNSSTAGSAISLNIGVRGLTGRFTPRSTVLLDGIPMAVAPYGQPQLSFAPVSLFNIESIDVVRSGGAVRYGPQNVGGVINFKTRSIPNTPGLTADATVRENIYTAGGGANTQYGLFLGTQMDNGLGLALLYSGMVGRDWRRGSDERVNDLALKFRYEITPEQMVYGKVSYYDVKSKTPGGLTVAQFNADPFQNTRPDDYWSGNRTGLDFGYLNTISETQEFEVRTFYNESYRQSTLVNPAFTQTMHQPRNYQTFGFEPRFTQRLFAGPTAHDVTVGYRYVHERGDDNNWTTTLATGRNSAIQTFNNFTSANAFYIDDRIAWGNWRLTPGVRYETISSQRVDNATNATYRTDNNKALPSVNLSYLVNDAWTLFADYSTSFGPVQNTQLNSMSASNPLEPELARTYEIGTRWTDKRWKAELTAFRMKFDNQILQVPGSSPATFQNIGATNHDGIETALDYTFDQDSALRGLNLYANFTYVRAIQKSGATSGLDVPFYSRFTDTLGARYEIGQWTFNVSTTHQSSQYSDLANTEAESADGSNGKVPGFRVWNLQAMYRIPGYKKADITVGLNNVFDKRYYTRNVDSNAGRMVGAPRMVYVQGHFGF